MTQFWTVTRLADGVVLGACVATPSTGSHPKDNGWPGWDAATQKATRIERQPNTVLEVWNGTGWVEDPAKVEALLIPMVDAQAGEARRPWLTMAPGQADAYREKMADVAALNGLGGTTTLILAALGVIAPAQQRERWPFLYAEMQASGLANLVVARDAIVAAASASRQARAEIERRRRLAKRAIRAATTAAGKRAAAIVDWGIV